MIRHFSYPISVRFGSPIVGNRNVKFEFKVGQIARNGTNPGLFQIRLQYVLARR